MHSATENWRRVDDGSIEFKTLRSKALTGCSDVLIMFKQVDAGTWHGRADSGFHVPLKRPSCDRLQCQPVLRSALENIDKRLVPRT